MHKPDPINEGLEKALMGLMPVALREDSKLRMDEMIDGLCGDSEVGAPVKRKNVKMFLAPGMAAAVAAGVFLSVNFKSGDANPMADSGGGTDADLVLLTESDRVERVSDDGLFVDSGGSAMRKVRVRVVEESQMRDEETGIVVMLSSPREEMYMVPVSTF